MMTLYDYLKQYSPELWREYAMVLGDCLIYNTQANKRAFARVIKLLNTTTRDILDYKRPRLYYSIEEFAEVEITRIEKGLTKRGICIYEYEYI